MSYVSRQLDIAMPASFPAGVYEPREIENVPGQTYDESKKTRLYADDINNSNAEIIAIEETLGVNPQGDFDTVASRLDRKNFPQILNRITGIDGLSDQSLSLYAVPSGFRLIVIGVIFEAYVSGTTITPAIFYTKNSETNDQFDTITSQGALPPSGSVDSRYFHQFISNSLGSNNVPIETIGPGFEFLIDYVGAVMSDHSSFDVSFSLFGYLIPE